MSPEPKLPAPLPISPLGRIEPGIISSSIERAVNDALKAVPPEKKGALLAVATTEGVRAVVAAKLDDDGDWKMAGWVGKDWTGPVSGGIAVMGSW